LCEWSGELDIREKEATTALADEASKRELLSDRVFDADSADAARGVLALLDESRQRATCARLALESIKEERERLAAASTAAIDSMLALVVSHAADCSGIERPLWALMLPRDGGPN
jgi:hypothetical protein